MAKNQIDLQDIIERWVWIQFNERATKKEKKLIEKQQISLEIDWKRVRFVHDEPLYTPEPPRPGSGTPINNVLFFTTFSNKTDQPQRYTFKTERTTSSSCTISVEEGFTKGTDLSIKLTTPNNILEANAGFKREFTVTNSAGQTLEQTLTWGVDSQIEVDSAHRAEAKLIIIEEEYSGRFTLKSTASGRVRAVFYNLKDNNSFIKAIEADIDDIIRRARERGWLSGENVTVDKDSRCVVLKTSGRCAFRYGLKQNVEVDQKRLDE